MEKCIGHRIQGGLQANCPVKKTCLHYLNSKPGDELKEPKLPIVASGCGNYNRMSNEEFRIKLVDELIAEIEKEKS